MSPWGIGTFEDELACDWIEDLEDSDPVAFLAHCLDLGDEQPLGYLACIGVLCSAEIISATSSNTASKLPEALQRWIESHPEIDLKPFVLPAIIGLRKVLAEDSEISLLWNDNEQSGSDWLKSKKELCKNLLSLLISESTSQP